MADSGNFHTRNTRLATKSGRRPRCLFTDLSILARNFCYAIFIILLFSAPPVAAQSLPAQPFELEADEIVYDQDSAIYTARGQVRLTRQAQVLEAEILTYDTKTGVVFAQGGIRFTEQRGHVLFAEEIELTDDLKEGFITGVRVLFSDETRLAAEEGRRSDGNRTEFRRVVFSPCPLCHNEAGEVEGPPLWQIKAGRVIHHQDSRQMVYRNAVLEFFGVPILYTPYLSFPDPGVIRKSGFLTPDIGSSTELGLRLELPYLFVISPSRDFTFMPIITSKEGIVLGGEYRARTGNGRYTLRGSFTNVDERDDNNIKTGDNEWRGHIFSTGRFDLSETWKWGFDAQLASDDTYLRRYDFSDADTLTSRLFTEKFSGRNYAAANAYFFQGLRVEDDAGETPFALPMLEYHFVTQPGWNNSHFELDSNLLLLHRTDGSDTRRLSVSGKWVLPYQTRFGLVGLVTAQLRGDLYNTSEFEGLDSGPNENDGQSTARGLARLVAEARFPLARLVGHSRHVIEPIIQIVASPEAGNPDEIPNEDSQGFEFDDSVLFEANRFHGLDRWEEGSRVTYGIRYAVFGQKTNYFSVLLGQSVRLKDDDNFVKGSGLEGHRSDYVARVQWNWRGWLDYHHRFRFDKDDLSVERQEVDVTIGPKQLRINLNFLDLDRGFDNPELPDLTEIKGGLRLQLLSRWSLAADAIRRLDGKDQTINAGVGIIYQDPCIRFEARLRKDFTRDRDDQPSTSISFRIVLKHLG